MNTKYKIYCNNCDEVHNIELNLSLIRKNTFYFTCRECGRGMYLNKTNLEEYKE